MTLSRQPIRVLSATLLASALYAGPGQAQEATDASEPVAAPEATVAKPKPFVASAVKPKPFVPKRKAAPAPTPITAPEVAPPEPVEAKEPAAAPVPVPTPARPEATKASAERPWLRGKASQPVASAAPVTSPWRMIALGAVVLGLGGAALFQRRRRTSLARAVRSDLTVLSAVRLGGKAQVVVVNVGGRKLLLGVTEAEVSRLAWLDGDLDAAAPDPELDQDFRALDAAGGMPDSELFAPGMMPSEPRMIPPEPAQAEPPRRFRQLLFNALGQEPQPAPRAAAARAKAMGAFNAADEIAEGTRDVMTRTSASRTSASRVASPAGAPEMVDIEGQARGLILRLQKRA